MNCSDCNQSRWIGYAAPAPLLCGIRKVTALQAPLAGTYTVSLAKGCGLTDLASLSVDKSIAIPRSQDLTSPMTKRNAQEQADLAPIAEEFLDVQGQPRVVLRERGQTRLAIKVDAAVFANGILVLKGWLAGELTLSLIADGERLDFKLLRYERNDVVKALGLIDPNAKPGFILCANVSSVPVQVLFSWKVGAGKADKEEFAKISFVESEIDEAIVKLGPASGRLLATLSEETAWRKAILKDERIAEAGLDAAAGFVDAALGLGDDGGVVTGWCVSKPGVHCWLSDTKGNVVSVSTTSRLDRADIHAAYGARFGSGCFDAGFVARWPFPVVAGEKIRIVTVAEAGPLIITERLFDQFSPDPVALARFSFGIPVVNERRLERFSQHDGVLIEKLLGRRATGWNTLPVLCWDLGPQPLAPAISIVVPLYKRWDFVESQLLEFAADPAFADGQIELIYVVDDPGILDPLKASVDNLYKLYKVPFKMVWGHANRGFSGANNLGVAHSTAPVLIFLNSDAFPNQPGWATQLAKTLQENPDFGAIGPRLLLADQGIQHAGMAFDYSRHYGVWLNKHPMLGLDQRHDVDTGLREVPAVTGACMAMRRADFDRIGGWDTGYLIGDFEDSDLCLKLRADGMKIGYLPEVNLTHLERQSIRLMEDSGFRQQVVLWNAARHTHRWGEQLTQMQSSAQAASNAKTDRRRHV
jgi:GT2 family glycosyltransferase